MATTTEKLALHLPDYTDEIYETIEQLGHNFAKLDEVSPDYGTAPPVAGTWQQRHIVWNAEPAIGDYAGWVNTRTGRTAPSWTELTSYKTGIMSSRKTDNAHVYICICRAFRRDGAGLPDRVRPGGAGHAGSAALAALEAVRSTISYFRRSITAVLCLHHGGRIRGPKRNGR